MSPVDPHKGPIVLDKYDVKGWTWNWLDAVSKVTMYGYGETFADALNAQGYVEIDGQFYKKGQEPQP